MVLTTMATICLRNCRGERGGLKEGQTPVIEDKEQRSFADGDARMMLMKRGEFDYL